MRYIASLNLTIRKEWCDTSDVINPEQESLASEAEAAISEWIRSQYK